MGLTENLETENPFLQKDVCVYICILTLNDPTFLKIVHTKSL